MRYQLTQLIQGLSKEEVRIFKIHSSRFNQKGKEKKLLLLFDYIRKEKYDEYDDKLLVKVFPDKNKNGYYRLKNRLIEEIEISLAQLHRKKDEESKIYHLLHLAKIFSYKVHYKQAANYLKEAEKIAIKLEHYEILNIIYKKFIELSRATSAINPNIYIEKRNQLFTQKAKVQHFEDVLAKVNHQLRRTNFSKSPDIHETLKKTLDALSLDQQLVESPKIQFFINRCVRDTLVQQKDFKLLANYLTETYKEFEQRKFFNRSTHEEKIIMISWLINALTKSNQFDKTKNYIELLSKVLKEFNGLFYDKYIWLLHQTTIITYTYTNQPDKAIQLLLKLLQDKSLETLYLYNIFVHVNLASLYYCKNDINQALTYLAAILFSDHYKKLSPEWQTNIAIFEIMLRLESADFQYASNRLSEINRKMLNKSSSDLKRKKCFTYILKKISKTPRPYKDKKILALIDDFITDSPEYEPGSNEVVNYKLWLESKILKQPYYPLMLKAFRQAD